MHAQLSSPSLSLSRSPSLSLCLSLSLSVSLSLSLSVSVSLSLCLSGSLSLSVCLSLSLSLCLSVSLALSVSLSLSVCLSLSEECVLVVGEVVGHISIRSASRMNGAVVLFLDKVEKVNTIVENGIVLYGSLIKVFPLVNPARKVLLSNVPPFISDEALKRELSRYGQLVSAIKKIPLGCKSPLLKHVVSFRRQVHMILRSDIDELNITFKFKVDSFDYLIFVTTESMKCFGCRKVGHLVRACPEINALKFTDVESGSNEGQSVEKESEVGEASDLSVDKEDPGSRVKSSEKIIKKMMRQWILFLMRWRVKYSKRMKRYLKCRQ